MVADKILSNLYDKMKGHFMNNITLIGMPGAGKSTIGVVLAKVLDMSFLIQIF